MHKSADGTSVYPVRNLVPDSLTGMRSVDRFPPRFWSLILLNIELGESKPEMTAQIIESAMTSIINDRSVRPMSAPWDEPEELGEHAPPPWEDEDAPTGS